MAPAVVRPACANDAAVLDPAAWAAGSGSRSERRRRGSARSSQPAQTCSPSRRPQLPCSPVLGSACHLERLSAGDSDPTAWRLSERETPWPQWAPSSGRPFPPSRMRSPSAPRPCHGQTTTVVRVSLDPSHWQSRHPVSCLRQERGQSILVPRCPHWQEAIRSQGRTSASREPGCTTSCVRRTSPVGRTLTE
jgi:hypothetical protein